MNVCTTFPKCDVSTFSSNILLFNDTWLPTDEPNRRSVWSRLPALSTAETMSLSVNLSSNPRRLDVVSISWIQYQTVLLLFPVLLHISVSDFPFRRSCFACCLGFAFFFIVPLDNMLQCGWRESNPHPPKGPGPRPGASAVSPHPLGNADSRSRTCTGRKAHDRLRVARLPIPPHPQEGEQLTPRESSALCRLSYPALLRGQGSNLHHGPLKPITRWQRLTYQAVKESNSRFPGWSRTPYH